MVAKKVEPPSDLLLGYTRFAEFLSVRFRPLVPALAIEVILSPLGKEADSGEKNQPDPHDSVIDVMRISGVSEAGRTGYAWTKPYPGRAACSRKVAQRLGTRAEAPLSFAHRRVQPSQQW